MHKLLVLDKHAGPTSFDVVEAVRKATGIRKVGHSGTLDPLASGVLLVCTGRATRAIEHFMNLGKVYDFSVRLGVATSTLDSEGEITSEAPVPAIDDTRIVEVAERFVGDYDMAPPAYSAIKQNGKRLYELARAGEQAVIEKRRVAIHELEVTRIALPDVDFRMRCSRGTYVRSFARDFGAALDMPAHLRRLVRTRIGGFRIEDAYPCEKVFAGDVNGMQVQDLSTALGFLPGVVLSDTAGRALIDGGLPGPMDVLETIARPAETRALRLLDTSGGLLAIGNRTKSPHDGRLVESFRLFVDRRGM